MKFLFSFLILFTQLLAYGQNDKSTIVSPIKNIKIDSLKSVIYCAGVEMVWNELILNLQSTVKTKSKNNLVEILNQATQNFDNPLEEDFYVAKAGLVKSGIIEQINSELKEKFDTIWDKRQNYTSKDFVAFSLLKKKIQFKQTLGDLFYRNTFNRKEYVDYFGLERSNSKNVIIHDYQDKNDFIVELKCVDSLDQVYFVKTAKAENLEDLYLNSIKRIGLGKSTQINANEVLKIPFLKFDVLERYEELENTIITNKKFKNANIESFEHGIDFDLNQYGVDLFSKTEMILEFADVEINRSYVFDKPFLIILKRKNEGNPYFLYWVTNTDFMRRYDLGKREIQQSEFIFVGKWTNSEGTNQIESRKLVFQFFKDGTFVKVRNNIEKSGNWFFNAEKQEIKIYFNDRLDYRDCLIWKIDQKSESEFHIGKDINMTFIKQ